ncbi:hypothetical protein B0H16DRAFT_1785238 [Mycena metata]|uniref:C2H2-type domain-containing protein n=1 Tax=Mycena metata TaxID=1033252 RepID=A0AAD7NMT2_9AGAR|nr:hypothetical protein B0H16DRAFT_1785238 [Mycena metata]
MAPLEKTSSTMSEFMLRFNLAEAIDRMSMPPEEAFAMLRAGLESEETPWLSGATDYLLPTAPSYPPPLDALDFAVANQGGSNQNGKRKHSPEELEESSTFQSTATPPRRRKTNQPETVSRRTITRSASARNLLIEQTQSSPLNGGGYTDSHRQRASGNDESSQQNGGALTRSMSTRSMTGNLFALGHNPLPPHPLNQQHLGGRGPRRGREVPSNKHYGVSKEASARGGNFNQGSSPDLPKKLHCPHLGCRSKFGREFELKRHLNTVHRTMPKDQAFQPQIYLRPAHAEELPEAKALIHPNPIYCVCTCLRLEVAPNMSSARMKRRTDSSCPGTSARPGGARYLTRYIFRDPRKPRKSVPPRVPPSNSQMPYPQYPSFRQEGPYMPGNHHSSVVTFAYGGEAPYMPPQPPQPREVPVMLAPEPRYGRGTGPPPNGRNTPYLPPQAPRPPYGLAGPPVKRESTPSTPSLRTPISGGGRHRKVKEEDKPAWDGGYSAPPSTARPPVKRESTPSIPSSSIPSSGGQGGRHRKVKEEDEE